MSIPPDGPYPDILFHFTSGSGLRGILKEGFRPSYAREKIVGQSGERNFAVPIVSFCDLRLSELPFHMRKYKRFGIGLTKLWAQKKALNPVAYANKDSEFTNALLRGLDGYLNHIQKIVDFEKLMKASESYMDILNVLRYIKNYEGELTRRSRNARIYRFADEREWRYVLPRETKNILSFIPNEHIETDDKKDFFNAQIASHLLNYSAADVKYIIVPSDKNILPMRQYIKGLTKYHADEKEHFLSRILTAKQIQTDM
jgi:hypothetical protein